MWTNVHAAKFFVDNPTINPIKFMRNNGSQPNYRIDKTIFQVQFIVFCNYIETPTITYASLHWKSHTITFYLNGIHFVNKIYQNFRTCKNTLLMKNGCKDKYKLPH